jgi:AAA15 family ATPase/GTPase
VNNKLDGKIIEFLQKLNDDILDIKLIEENGIKRFVVILDSCDIPRDITSFGEGLQRIFEISLAFANCKNGVLLIDELETAIHKDMLIDFTQFIQELANEFNVQVFLTSHSKECIDAFVKNDYKDNTELMAYLLEKENDEYTYQYIDGNRLENLVKNMDLDIRGKQSE